MSNITVFAPGHIIGFSLPDEAGRTIEQAFANGGSVIIRLNGENATAELLDDMEPSQHQKDHSTYVFNAAKWAATMTFNAAGYTTAEQRMDAGIDIGSITASCVEQAQGDVGTAAGLGVSAASRILTNLRAQEQGTADSLGIAPDRNAALEGRYDGSF